MDLHVYTGLHTVTKIKLIHKKPKELIHVLYYVSISESTVQLVISVITCIWMWRHAPMAHHSRSPWPHLRPWAPQPPGLGGPYNKQFIIRIKSVTQCNINIVKLYCSLKVCCKVCIYNLFCLFFLILLRTSCRKLYRV